MKKNRCRKAKKLIRVYERLYRNIKSTLPISLKKQTCTMVLHFSVKDYDKYKTIDDFVLMLNKELVKMCRSNDLEIEGFCVPD